MKVKTADKILEKLKREGSITAKQLSSDLDMTSMGARQHLQSLNDSGLVEFYDVKVKVGRPTRHWKLTSQGHEQFSDKHNELSIQIIEAVGSIYGQDGIKKIAQERENLMLSRYQEALSDSTSLVEKIKKLVQLREQDGYMAEIQPLDNGYLLIENHCPICSAASSCPALCQSELNVFKAILGDHISIERTEHIINKERRCVYSITEES